VPVELLVEAQALVQGLLSLPSQVMPMRKHSTWETYLDKMADRIVAANDVVNSNSNMNSSSSRSDARSAQLPQFPAVSDPAYQALQRVCRQQYTELLPPADQAETVEKVRQKLEVTSQHIDNIAAFYVWAYAPVAVYHHYYAVYKCSNQCTRSTYIAECIHTNHYINDALN
jgi:hypothetical protein